MLKFLLAIVILIHSLIHLLGFVKEWNLAQVKGLTGEILNLNYVVRGSLDILLSGA